MDPVSEPTLTQAQRQQVDAWIGEQLPNVPEPVATFLKLHRRYLSAEAEHAVARRFNETVSELRRAMGITASSERRRSKNPLATVPSRETKTTLTARERLEQQRVRSARLGDWHDGLHDRHARRVTRIDKRLAEMNLDAPQGTDSAREAAPAASDVGLQAQTGPVTPQAADPEPEQEITIDTPVEQIELTEAEKARARAHGQQLAEHLERGSGADPALQSSAEALMSEGVALSSEEVSELAAQLPEQLADAQVVKTLSEPRVRYDISLEVKPITLNVQKHVVVKPNGERTVVSVLGLTHDRNPRSRNPRLNRSRKG